MKICTLKKLNKMTSYYLSVGYQATTPYIPYPKSREDYEETLWNKLKESFYQVCLNKKKLRDEILEIGFQKRVCHNKEKENTKILDECLGCLFESVKLGPNSYPGIESEEKRISFNTNCETKYQVYRAVIRGVMYKMHKLGIEINIEVC